MTQNNFIACFVVYFDAFQWLVLYSVEWRIFWVGKDVEGRKKLNRIFGLRAEIWNRYLPNRKQAS
jgi:hypothetical protein